MADTYAGETVTAELDTPAIRGTPLTGDDSAFASGSSRDDDQVAPLPDGGRMVWLRDSKPLTTKEFCIAI